MAKAQTRTRQRLLSLFNKIEDPVIREAIVEAVTIEAKNSTNPDLAAREIRNAIDHIASRVESKATGN